MVFWISFKQIRPGVMKSVERYDLAKTKQIESLAEYLFTHIVKYGVIILKEVEKKKKNP